MFSFFSKGYADYSKLAYDFKFNSIDGGQINLDNYREKVIVIVNVASRCGFTNQYEDLQDIWSNYKEKDLVVVGIPTNNFRQEPGSNKEIKEFCETNFNINFPMSEKLDVIGNNAHPFYKWGSPHNLWHIGSGNYLCDDHTYTGISETTTHQIWFKKKQ